MARIRSVHPGLFTDEAFVELSDGAQIFLIGLWTEADDQGVFEWKPKALKMKLRPASTSPVDPLLDELERGNMIKRFDIDGRSIGAIRNFTKYQRPKYPKAQHTITDDVRNYISPSARAGEVRENEPGDIPEIGGVEQKEISAIRGNLPADGDGEEDGGKGKLLLFQESNPKKGAYAFEGRVVRLNQADFDRWQASFTHIELRAKLESRDAYLAEQSGEAQRKWFQSTATWLANENQKASLELRKDAGRDVRSASDTIY